MAGFGLTSVVNMFRTSDLCLRPAWWTRALSGATLGPLGGLLDAVQGPQVVVGWLGKICHYDMLRTAQLFFLGPGLDYYKLYWTDCEGGDHSIKACVLRAI